IAVFTQRLVVDRSAGANHGLRIELVGYAQPRAKCVHPGLAKTRRCAVDAGVYHRPGNPPKSCRRATRAEVTVMKMPLLLRHWDFITQAEVQRQLCACFKIILRIPG